MDEEKSKNSSKNFIWFYVIFVLVYIVSFFYSKVFPIVKGYNEIQEKESLKIENTCWYNELSDKYLCFSDDKVYNIVSIDGNYRKTEHADDCYKYEKIASLNGKFKGNDFKWYEYKIDYTNKKFNLILYYYEKKDSLSRYSLSDLKNSDFKSTYERIKINIFNNNFNRPLSNEYLINFNTSVETFFRNYEDVISFDNKTHTYDKGYRIINNVHDESKLYFVNTSLDDIKVAMDNFNYVYLKPYQVCYSTNNLSKQEDFTKLLDVKTNEVIIDYCNNFK